MARACAICGKTSMGGFNPSLGDEPRPGPPPLPAEPPGHDAAREERRAREGARLHPLPPDPHQERPLARSPVALAPAAAPAALVPSAGLVTIRAGGAVRQAVGVEPDRERAVVDQLDGHLARRTRRGRPHAGASTGVREP